MILNLLLSKEFLVALLVLAFYWFWKGKEKRKLNLPPGPFQWPLIGNTIEMGRRPYIAFVKWAKQYGPVYQVNMAGHQTVVISDEKLIREALGDAKLTGRPTFEMFELLQEGAHGLINSQKEEWSEQRRFSLRQLRDFGFGKRGMEDLIQNEVKALIEHFESLEGQAIDSMKQKYSLVVVNALWMMVSGHRFDLNDPQLLEIYAKMTRFQDEMSLALFFPKLAKLMPNLTGLTRILEFVQEIRSFIKGAIDEHLQNPSDDPDQPRDFMDAYLNEINKTTDPSSSFYKEAGNRSMIATVIDLFNAGLETTSSSLNWMTLYMAKYPQVQKKVQQELDSILGSDRTPTIADRQSLTYCEATVQEMLRRSSIVPQNLIHLALEDMQIQGYDIPQGTWVTANFYHLHHNPALWKGDPNTFDPSRFLSEEVVDGKKVVKVQRPSHLMPFSVGKRVCIGEIMARDSIFLFFTSIVQKFNIELAPESKDATVEPKPGLGMTPEPYKVILTQRTVV